MDGLVQEKRNFIASALELRISCINPAIYGPLSRYNCGLRMRRGCFPRHRFQRKPLVSDPGMHHGTCVTHVPWCMSGSLSPGGGENVPGIPGACATRNFTYLVRGPWCRGRLIQVSVYFYHHQDWRSIMAYPTPCLHVQPVSTLQVYPSRNVWSRRGTGRKP